jgi:hypothetical protein
LGKRIVITGATGLIGKHLCKELSDRGDILTIFSRDPDKAKSIIPYANEYVKWNYRNPEEWKEHINSKDIVIHFAGANLFGKRWTDSYKEKIIESREISTQNIVKAIGEADEKPEVFICASAIGYYGNKGEELLTEESPPGDDFLSKVCLKWENEAAGVEKYNVRRISVRTGVVLTTEAGALKEFLTPFKLFVGGPLGTGNQWFSWIHLTDIIRVYLFLIDNANINGAVNTSSPNPVKMKEFANTLGKVLNRPSFFKVPGIALQIAVGEVAETVTASLRVVPQKLEQHNFNFRFRKIEEALRDLLEK